MLVTQFSVTTPTSSIPLARLKRSSIKFEEDYKYKTYQESTILNYITFTR